MPGFYEPVGFGADPIAFGCVEEARPEEGVPHEEGLALVHFAVRGLEAPPVCLMMGLIAEGFDSAEELALHGPRGAAGDGYILIPYLAHQIGIAEGGGKDGFIAR